MTLPGFSAEAAVYSAARHYYGNRADSTWSAASAVQPAAAIYMDGRFVCYGEVGPLGIPNCYPSGGGGGEFCRPQCTPCRNVPGEGRLRFCVRRNCDIDEIPC